MARIDELRQLLLTELAPFFPSNTLSTLEAYLAIGGISGGSSGATTAAFSSAIKFDKDFYTVNHIISAPVNFTAVTAGAIPWGGTAMRLVADGSTIPTFDSVFFMKGDTWDNTAGRVHDIIFIYNGSEYEVTISVGKTVSIPDVTVPVITARNSNSTTTVTMTGSEVLVASSFAGWSVKKGANLGAATNLAISAMSGSNSPNLVFTVGAIAPGDGLWVSYNATLGNTVDAVGNPLASFTDQVITNNNVSMGLIAEYLMEEATGATRLDTAGTFNLTQTGNVPQVAGKVGFAAGFSASKLLSNATVAPNAPGGAQPWTVNFWQKVNSLPASDCGVLGRATEFGVYQLSAGTIRCSITNSPGNLFDRAWGTAISLGTWQMRTIVFTGSALNLYTNGALDNGASVSGGAGNQSGVQYSSDNSLYIGDAGFSTNAPDYAIDQVRMYNTALTLVQIQNLYNGGAGI